MILRSVLTLAFLGIPSALPHTMESRAAQIPLPAAPVEDDWIVPRDPAQAWFVPERPTGIAASADIQALANGVQRISDEKFDEALRLLRSARTLPPELTPYGEYYIAVAMLQLGQAEAAEQRLVTLRERSHPGYLNEAAALSHARAAETQGGYQRAIRIYQDLFNGGNAGQPDAVLMRMARVQFAAGEPRNALSTFARVYYEYPLTDSARDARSEIARLERILGEGPPSRTFETDFERAERLFGSRRYADALDMFERLKSAAADERRAVMALRLAAIHLQGKRFQLALTAADPYVNSSAHQSEARYYRSSALRGLGRHDQFVAEVRRLAADYPDDPWTEIALDSLATHYVLTDNDAAAAKVFEDLYAKFPKGRLAERAAWHSGWWNYRAGRYAATAATFEQAAIDFPRADYRPAYLYWAGRAREHLKEPDTARALYSRDIFYYQNSYYGRLAQRRMTTNGWSVTPVESTPTIVEASALTSPPRALDALPNEAVIRELLSAGLFDDAINELRFAARVWGASPKIDATIAWAYHEKGELRRAINLMKRAYPSYLAAGGEALPVDVQKVLFPLDYWDLIREHSANHGLDPYLVAALIAQESTFVADIKSSANAYGLMQILPSTGRRLARAERLGGAFSTKVLKNPEANIRLGTRFFAGLLRRFKDSHLALASYNAGESRVVRWLAQKPGLSADEFIDDIPFPETRNYVKKVLGTADDYRRLYGVATTSSE